MKWVAVERVHVRPHEEEFLGGDEVGAAEPLIVGPGVGFAEGVGDLDEAAVGGGHEGIYFLPQSLPRRRRGPGGILCELGLGSL